jgi:hypothetical protein
MLEKTVTGYVSLEELAEQDGHAKSATLRAIRRWELEAGPRLLKARAGGGHKRCLLSQQDADAFLAWRLDCPTDNTSNGSGPDIFGIVAQLSNIVAQLTDIARALTNDRNLWTERK